MKKIKKKFKLNFYLKNKRNPKIYNVFLQKIQKSKNYIFAIFLKKKHESLKFFYISFGFLQFSRGGKKLKTNEIR